MTTLNRLGKFSESTALGISLLNKGTSYFDLLLAIVDGFIGLGDMESANKYYQEAYESGPGDPGINKIIDSLGIDKQMLVPPITLSTEDLEKITGEYVNSWNGTIISITVDRDTILYSSPGGKYQLIPTAKNRVYFSNTPTTIEFIFDGEKGNPAPHFILHLPDGEDLIFGRKN